MGKTINENINEMGENALTQEEYDEILKEMKKGNNGENKINNILSKKKDSIASKKGLKKYFLTFIEGLSPFPYKEEQIDKKLEKFSKEGIDNAELTTFLSDIKKIINNYNLKSLRYSYRKINISHELKNENYIIFTPKRLEIENFVISGFKEPLIKFLRNLKNENKVDNIKLLINNFFKEYTGVPFHTEFSETDRLKKLSDNNVYETMYLLLELLGYAIIDDKSSFNRKKKKLIIDNAKVYLEGGKKSEKTLFSPIIDLIEKYIKEDIDSKNELENLIDLIDNKEISNKTNYIREWSKVDFKNRLYKVRFKYIVKDFEDQEIKSYINSNDNNLKNLVKNYGGKSEEVKEIIGFKKEDNENNDNNDNSLINKFINDFFDFILDIDVVTINKNEKTTDIKKLISQNILKQVLQDLSEYNYNQVNIENLQKNYELYYYVNHGLKESIYNMREKVNDKSPLAKDRDYILSIDNFVPTILNEGPSKFKEVLSYMEGQNNESKEKINIPIGYNAEIGKEKKFLKVHLNATLEKDDSTSFKLFGELQGKEFINYIYTISPVSGSSINNLNDTYKKNYLNTKIDLINNNQFSSYIDNIYLGKNIHNFFVETPLTKMPEMMEFYTNNYFKIFSILLYFYYLSKKNNVNFFEEFDKIEKVKPKDVYRRFFINIDKDIDNKNGGLNLKDIEKFLKYDKLSYITQYIFFDILSPNDFNIESNNKKQAKGIKSNFKLKK